MITEEQEFLPPERPSPSQSFAFDQRAQLQIAKSKGHPFPALPEITVLGILIFCCVIAVSENRGLLGFVW
jgi:hypothetical protein